MKSRVRIEVELSLDHGSSTYPGWQIEAPQVVAKSWQKGQQGGVVEIEQEVS